MSSSRPYTWKPEEVLEVTNVSDENILLELDSGLLRLDKGRTLRLTASAMENHEIVRLANASNASFAIGGVGLAVGVGALVWSLTTDATSDATARARLEPVIGIGSLGLQGSF